jgi:hypothetical protein
MATSDAHGYREFCRRQHRNLGLYLVLYAWRFGWDGLAVERKYLELYLDLDRFKAERIRWIIDDLKEFFPYSKKIVEQGSADKFATIYLSRRQFDPFPTGTVSTTRRIGLLNEGGMRFGLVTGEDLIGGESKVASKLALIGAGITNITTIGSAEGK